MEERHLSLSEAAAALDISERTAYRWIKSGKLHAYKPGRDYRIPESAIEDVVKESEVRPKESRSSLELSLFNGLEDERRRTFIQSCRQYAESRSQTYEVSSATLTQEGGVYAGAEGARILFVEAYDEYRELHLLLGRDLAYLFVEGLSDYEAQRFSGLALFSGLRPLAETVERLADRAEELAQTEAQRAEVERRREQIREMTQRIA